MSNASRIFLFFSLGYFVSYLYRGVNIGFSTFLTSEIGLSAADLGLLTSLYFLGFSMTQIPAGAALDTWGPRRVNGVLVLFAAAGSVIFGLSDSMWGLMLGRLIIGIGVAVCLGAALQAMAFTFPMHRLPMINGAVVAIGGLGGAVVGTPLSMMLDVLTWRSASLWLAGFTVVVSCLLLFGAKDTGPLHGRHRPSMTVQLQGTLEIARNRLFWQILLFPSIVASTFYAVQSLWVKPFLLDVNHLPGSTVDGLVSLLGISAVVGSAASGLVARRVEKLGIGLYHFSGLLLALLVVVQFLILVGAPLPQSVFWAAYGFLGGTNILIYAVLVETFPRTMLGRVGTTFNMLVFFLIFAFQNAIGWVVELWQPVAPGVYPAQAHIVAWGLVLALQVAAGIWYFASQPPKPIKES